MTKNNAGELRDFFACLKAGTEAVFNPPPIIGRDTVGGLIVSTVNTNDLGYETAILDSITAYPVERYETLTEAEAGHKKWVVTAPELKEVLRLGYGETIGDEKVTLVPRVSV